MVEVQGKDISRECSRCGFVTAGRPGGSAGGKQDRRFICPSCGYEEEEKTNTALNAKKRGQGEGGLERS